MRFLRLIIKNVILNTWMKSRRATYIRWTPKSIQKTHQSKIYHVHSSHKIVKTNIPIYTFVSYKLTTRMKIDLNILRSLKPIMILAVASYKKTSNEYKCSNSVTSTMITIANPAISFQLCSLFIHITPSIVNGTPSRARYSK